MDGHKVRLQTNINILSCNLRLEFECKDDENVGMHRNIRAFGLDIDNFHFYACLENFSIEIENPLNYHPLIFLIYLCTHVKVILIKLF